MPVVVLDTRKAELKGTGDITLSFDKHKAQEIEAHFTNLFNEYR